MSVGEGRYKLDEDSSIHLMQSINVVQSCSELIDAIFIDITTKYTDKTWLTSRAVLTTTNSKLKSLNYEIIDRFPGIHSMFLSADSVVSEYPEDQKAMELKYPPEFLNSIDAGSSLPDHEIKLKKRFVVMLLRNVRQRCGHVNGTRYVVAKMTKNFPFLQVYLVLPKEIRWYYRE